MTVSRLLVVAACAISWGTIALGEDPFSDRYSEIPTIYDRTRDSEPTARRISYEERVDRQAERPAVTPAEARDLASWARDRVGAPTAGNARVTPADVRALEAWARAFDRRGRIRRVQNTVPADPNVPPAPKPIYETTDSDQVCAGGDCVGNCCQQCCQAQWVGGVEGVFLVPVGEPHQTVTITDLVTGEQRSGSSHPGLGAGVRAWLGLQWDCCGIRARYTYFGDDEVDNDPRVPQNPRFAFLETYDLSFQTFDLEVYKQFCLCDWFMEASFGARWARLDRNATTLGYGRLGNGVDVSGFAVGANDFEGTGFTASLGGRRPISCDSCWNCFWNFRGSYLWGDAGVGALTEANAIAGPPIGVGSAHSRDIAFANRDHEDAFIAEVQLGLEYERCLECIPATVFFRVGVEYQHWEINGPTAQTTSFAFLQGGPPLFGARVDSASDGSDGDLDLIGFVIGGGVRY